MAAIMTWWERIKLLIKGTWRMITHRCPWCGTKLIFFMGKRHCPYWHSNIDTELMMDLPDYPDDNDVVHVRRKEPKDDGGIPAH